jgi:hypothetical protein
MAIRTVTYTVPDPEQPLEELTRDEKQQTFKELGDLVSRLDTRRRLLFRILAAVDRRKEARLILDRTSPEVHDALRVELGLKT